MTDIPLIRLLADFNEVADDGLLGTLIPAEAKVSPGQKVYVLDHDDNSCMGEVVSLTGKLVLIRLDWSYWMPANPEFAKAVAEHLEELLQDRIDDLIGLWHDGAGLGMQIHEFLGITDEQYTHWVHCSRDLDPETRAKLTERWFEEFPGEKDDPEEIQRRIDELKGK